MEALIIPEPQYLVSPKVIFIALLLTLFHWALFYVGFYRFSIIVTIMFYGFSIIFPSILLIKFWRTKDTFVPYFVSEDFNLFLVALLVPIILFIISFNLSLSHFQKKDL